MIPDTLLLHRESAITYIDEARGEFFISWISDEQLAEKSNFVETSYLNFYMVSFQPNSSIMILICERYHTMVHEKMKNLMQGFQYDAHPMAMMVGVVGSFAAFYHDWMNMSDPADRRLAAIRLITKFRQLQHLFL